MSSGHLNPSQTAAVADRSGHLLIIAGPGTGKTHTLTCRIREIAESLSPAEQILAITFTRKAAGEMLARLSVDGPLDAQRIFVGTFHQWALKILTEYIRHAGLPSPLSVAGEETIEALAKTLWPSARNRERKANLDEISRYKSAGFDGPVPPLVRDYDAALRAAGLMDYDDLLLETYRLLKNDPEILQDLHQRVRYVFVDEYQDINPIQSELIKLLVGANTLLTAIGDPHQAIYGFRGSDPACFDDFSRHFPGAKVLTLTDNYRSAENILNASHQVISAGEDTDVLALTARIYREGRLIIREAPTDKAEAEYVVHQIERLVGGTSMFSQDSGRVDGDAESEHSFGDTAVLYRMHSQHRVLKEAFERSGIPYHIHGRPSQNDDEDQVCPPRSEEVPWDSEKVALMTIHAAKGLEFPVVFIVGCEEGLLPRYFEGSNSHKKEERSQF
jgi:DNA helicase-2/ATP-dependent DNA helicase PcrA